MSKSIPDRVAKYAGSQPWRILNDVPGSTMQTTIDIVMSWFTTFQFQEIAEQYKSCAPPPGSIKFLDLEKRIPKHVKEIYKLNLNRINPISILDIGSGPGYFMAIARYFGHNCVGIDTGRDALFNALSNYLALNIVISPIKAFTPLPNLSQRFHFLAGFDVCFNRYPDKSRWDLAEWHYFLVDLAQYSNSDAILHMDLVRQNDGLHYSDKLLEFFREHGTVNGKTVALKMKNFI